MKGEDGRKDRILGDPALARIWAALPQARIVGGCVRDMLFGISTHDIDLATPEPPERVTDILSAAGIKVAQTGVQHGTVTAVIDRRPFEITTLRKDIETDGRHAVVAWTEDWREDAARRDFTINAMYCDRAGKIHDYFGGRADLSARRVRFVGDAETRISEDALRLLRYFRFEARYGANAPDKQAMRAVHKLASSVNTLSAERVGAEFVRIIEIERVTVALNLMQETGVLGEIISNPDCTALARLVNIGAPPDAGLRLAALSPGSNPARQLKRSSHEAATIAFLLEPAPELSPEESDDALRRCLSDAPAARLILRSWLDQVHAPDGPSPEAWQRLRDRLSKMASPIFPVQGRDLLTEGFAAGAEMGAALKMMRSWWRDGGCTADKAACLDYLKSKWRLPPEDVSA